MLINCDELKFNDLVNIFEEKLEVIKLYGNFILLGVFGIVVVILGIIWFVYCG